MLRRDHAQMHLEIHLHTRRVDVRRSSATNLGSLKLNHA